MLLCQRASTLMNMGRLVMLWSQGMKSHVRLGSMWSEKCIAIPEPSCSLCTCGACPQSHSIICNVLWAGHETSSWAKIREGRKG